MAKIYAESEKSFTISKYFTLWVIRKAGSTTYYPVTRISINRKVVENIKIFDVCVSESGSQHLLLSKAGKLMLRLCLNLITLKKKSFMFFRIILCNLDINWSQDGLYNNMFLYICSLIILDRYLARCTVLTWMRDDIKRSSPRQ